MTYESFTCGLKNLEGDKKELKRLKDKKEDLEYLESGVSGVNPAKEHTSGNPSVIAQVRLAKIEEISELEEEINLIQSSIQHLMRTYERQDEEIKKILSAIYFEGNKKVDVARQFEFKSDMEMDRYLRREYLQ